MSKRKVKSKENKNLVWRRDRGAYACRWMLNGELKQQTLLDDHGIAITDIEKARIARDKLLAPYAIKEQDEVLAVLKARAERKRNVAQELVDETKPPLKISEAWNAYHVSPRKPDSGESTENRYHTQFKRFQSWVEAELPAVLLMRDVNEELAGKYVANLKTAKFSPSTFNKSVNFLALLWHTLQMQVNPWREIKRLNVPKEENRRRSITPEQFTVILSKADDADLHDLIFTLGWTGQRLVDVVMLKWSSVSFKRHVVELVPRKTARRSGSKVVAPLLPQLAVILKRRRDNVTGLWVFPELVKMYEHDPSLISRRIQKAFADAELIPREKRAGLKRAVAVYGAHSLRHYFVTEAMTAGLPVDLIRKITGHSNEAMAQHYQHVDASLFARLASHLNGNQGNDQPVALPVGTIEDWRGKVREMAGRLTAKTAKQIREELLTYTHSYTDRAPLDKS